MSNRIENGPYRQSAVNALRDRAKRMIQNGQQLMSLADQLDAIERSATQGTDGEGKHPYIGAGSDAEEALWELITSYRGI